MFRAISLLALLAWPITSSTDVGARDPLTSAHDAAFTAAERISPLVERRFAIVGAMAQCDYIDNQYAFDFALKKFARSERYILQKAAFVGWSEGAVRAAVPCGVSVDRLRAADDALLARAEVLPSP